MPTPTSAPHSKPRTPAVNTAAGDVAPLPVSEPVTNSTVSAPSRNTARATTTTNASGGLWPCCTDCPSCRASLTISRVMLLWHCVWVSTHTRQMVSDAKHLGHSVQEGQKTPWALLLVVALAVLREGAETVLFVGGTITGNATTQPVAVLTAGALGLLSGALVGLGVYAGLSRIPTRRVFSVTNVLIALLAGSLASQLARALAQAGFIESWTAPLWDSTDLLSPASALGTFLHALVGYDAQPSGAQLCGYGAVLIFIYVGTRLLQPRAVIRSRSRSRPISSILHL